MKTKAEKGDAKAQLEIALMYKEGINLQKDIEKSIKWLKISADNGNIEAKFNLGDIYYSGNGINKDLIIAHEWFLESAKQGHVIRMPNGTYNNTLAFIIDSNIK